MGGRGDEHAREGAGVLGQTDEQVKDRETFLRAQRPEEAERLGILGWMGASLSPPGTWIASWPAICVCLGQAGRRIMGWAS